MASSFPWVTGPTPKMRLTASGRRKSDTSPGCTTTSPSGLSRSEAILATCLLGATPTETTRSSSRRILSLSDRATCSGVPCKRSVPVMSTKASSSDRGSTSGEKLPRIAITWAET